MVLPWKAGIYPKQIGTDSHYEGGLSEMAQTGASGGAHTTPTSLYQSTSGCEPGPICSLIKLWLKQRAHANNNDVLNRQTWHGVLSVPTLTILLVIVSLPEDRRLSRCC